MRRSLLTVVVALLAAAAGCLGAVTDVLDRESVVRAPSDVVFTGGVTPALDKQETFTVPGEMRAVTVAMSLETTGAPTAPPVTPASLEVQIVSPSGDPVGPSRTLDAQHTRDSVTIRNPAAGTYTVELSGNGLSDGSQGATYTLTVSYTPKSS